MGNHWLDKVGHFCDARITRLSSKWMEFEIEAIKSNTPDLWNRLKLKVGDKYALQYSDTKFLCSPTPGAEIEISQSSGKYVIRERR